MGKGRRIVSVLVRLRPDLHRAVKARAREEDRPMSHLVREALRQYLEARAS